MFWFGYKNFASVYVKIKHIIISQLVNLKKYDSFMRN